MPIKGELNWQNRVIWKDTVGIIGTSGGIAVRRRKNLYMVFLNILLQTGSKYVQHIKILKISIR